RPPAHPVRRCHLRHHPAQALEDRRPGAPERAPDQDRHGLALPVSARVPPRLPLPEARRRLLSAVITVITRAAGASARPASGPHPPLSSRHPRHATRSIPTAALPPGPL